MAEVRAHACLYVAGVGNWPVVETVEEIERVLVQAQGTPPDATFVAFRVCTHEGHELRMSCLLSQILGYTEVTEERWNFEIERAFEQRAATSALAEAQTRAMLALERGIGEGEGGG